MNFFRYALKAANYISKFHLNSPRVKGFIGEKQVNKILYDEPYKIHNVNIGTTRRAQIDHIVINEKGIIVIETKNYRGLIKGKIDEQLWIQYINNKKYAFLNPVIQNRYHINVLRDNYPELSEYFHSVVVFTNNAKVIVDVKGAFVYASDVSNYIKNLPNCGFSAIKQKELYELLMDVKETEV